MLMTQPFLATLSLLASRSESVIAPPFTPALIIGLCVAAGLSTWLALPSKREPAVGRVALVALGTVGVVVAALLVRWTIDFGGMGVYFWLFSAIALFASVRVITHTKPVYSALYFVLTVFATGGLFVLLWAEFIAAALVLIYAGAILITYVFVIMLASEAVSTGDDSSKLVTDHDAVSRDPFWAALTGFAVTGLLIFVIFDKSSAIDRQEGAMAVTSMAMPHTPLGRPGGLPPLYADVDRDLPASSWGNGQQDRIFTKDGGGNLQAPPAVEKADELTPDLGSAQALGQELLENQALNLQLAAVILTVAMVGAITLARRRVIVQVTPGQDLLSTPSAPVDDNPKTIAIYGTDNPRHKAYPEN